MKVLPESFASGPERLARFQREAGVPDSFNHPDIAAIDASSNQMARAPS